MLEHAECPRCQAPNLSTEMVCFACGAPLRPLPKRRRAAPTRAPWPLWAGLAVGLVAAGLVGWQVVAWLAGYRAKAGLPMWWLPAGGAGLVVVGQALFWQARRMEARWWRLKRAPELAMAQARVGDVVWMRGMAECEAPLIAPYTAGLPTAQGEAGGLACVYYRYVRQEREEDRTGWNIVERDTRAVDFRVGDGDESVYVPSGRVLFDAPLYAERFLDPSGTVLMRVWALSVGAPVSVCGQVAGEASRPRIGAPGENLPVVVTWRLVRDYVALVARRARARTRIAWALTIAGLLGLIASAAQLY